MMVTNISFCCILCEIGKIAHYKKPWDDTIFIPLLKIGLMLSSSKRHLAFKRYVGLYIYIHMYNFSKSIVDGCQLFGKSSIHLAYTNTKKIPPLEEVLRWSPAESAAAIVSEWERVVLRSTSILCQAQTTIPFYISNVLLSPTRKTGIYLGAAISPWE